VTRTCPFAIVPDTVLPCLVRSRNGLLRTLLLSGCAVIVFRSIVSLSCGASFVEDRALRRQFTAVLLTKQIVADVIAVCLYGGRERVC
jgi:hypothetical protein